MEEDVIGPRVAVGLDQWVEDFLAVEVPVEVRGAILAAAEVLAEEDQAIRGNICYIMRSMRAV